MDLDETIREILVFRSDLNRKEIIEMIEKKKEGVCNFLTDETAARIVASELGLKVHQKPVQLKIQIKDLIPGLNDVTIRGNVISIYPSKTFKRRDWTKGKLASILVSDKTGTLRVVLWDNKTEIIENDKIQKKQKIRISHGYVRLGLDGNPELHLGDKATIDILENPKKN